MTNMQVTSTGVAVSLAVVVALGMLFLGPNIFAPFRADRGEVATTTLSNSATTTMNQTGPQVPAEIPTELSGSEVAVGTGAEAVQGSTVTVNYVGMLPDGTVFDASERHGQPFTFTLGAGKVIQGWDIGVQGMREGGRRQLIIPAEYAYGAEGIPGVIPPNATLIFNVELLSVQ